MIGLWTLGLVLAEDQRVPLSSARLDAVLVLPTAVGAPGAARLLVADATTSAPLGVASATLSLSGPAAATAVFAGDPEAAAPGFAAGSFLFPTVGAYAGSVILELADPTRTELLAVSGVTVPEPPSLAVPAARWGLAIGAVLLAAILGFTGGALVGGLRRAVAGVLLAGLAVSAPRVSAHGGEDHSAGPTAAAGGTDVVLPMESQFLLGLRTARVLAEPFQARTLGLGALTSAPGGAATLRAPVSGTLEAPSAGFPAPGSTVRAGQILAFVRETPSTADRVAVVDQRAAAEGRLAEARAALALAERDAAGAGALGEVLAEREHLRRTSAVEVATVQVREAERAAAGAGLTVAVTAPLSGRLSLGGGRPGDQVGAGDELFRVVSNSALWVRASVPEGEAAAIEPGSRAEVALPSLPGRVYAAVVLDGGLASDPLTGTVAVTLALEPDPALRPGRAATAWIATGASEVVPTVPDDAVVESNGVRFVFVKLGPERFEAREVALGVRSADRWEVHAGLAAGERVVVSGTYALKSLAGR